VEGVRFEDRGRRQLRGIAERLRLFELVWWDQASDSPKR
jgi:hypothetical protein